MESKEMEVSEMKSIKAKIIVSVIAIIYHYPYSSKLVC